MTSLSPATAVMPLFVVDNGWDKECQCYWAQLLQRHWSAADRMAFTCALVGDPRLAAAVAAAGVVLASWPTSDTLDPGAWQGAGVGVGAGVDAGVGCVDNTWSGEGRWYRDQCVCATTLSRQCVSFSSPQPLPITR